MLVSTHPRLDLGVELTLLVTQPGQVFGRIRRKADWSGGRRRRTRFGNNQLGRGVGTHAASCDGTMVMITRTVHLVLLK